MGSVSMAEKFWRKPLFSTENKVVSEASRAPWSDATLEFTG